MAAPAGGADAAAGAGAADKAPTKSAPTVSGTALNGTPTKVEKAELATATTGDIKANDEEFKFELGDIKGKLSVPGTGGTAEAKAKAVAEAFNKDADLSKNWTAEATADGKLKLTQKTGENIDKANIKFGQKNAASATATGGD